MKNKRIIILILVIILSVIALLYIFKGNKYAANDITDYLKQYNVEFNIKDIKDQKIHLENINNNPLALFECSPKKNSSITFYIYETYSSPGLPFGKNVLADNYWEVVNTYLENKYIKKITIENYNSIDNAIKEIDSIREQIYYEKSDIYGITTFSSRDAVYIPIKSYNNTIEKSICFQYGENTRDVLIKELNIKKDNFLT